MSISNTNQPIYKSLFNLKVLKQQMRITPFKRKSMENFLKMYNDAIIEAKDYKSKAPTTASNKDIFKAAHHAGMASAVAGSSYVNPKSYITKNEYEDVIKELTACKKYLESELKQLESTYHKDVTAVCESIFDFEFE